MLRYNLDRLIVAAHLRLRAMDVEDTALARYHMVARLRGEELRAAARARQHRDSSEEKESA